MVSLARSLGLEAVGEGVETAEQLEHLEAIGCELAQGFYLARPLPREEVEFLLAGRSISWPAARDREGEAAASGT